MSGDTPRSRPNRSSSRKRRLLVVGGGNFMRSSIPSRNFLIPSAITMVGTFCGFLAIVSAIQGHFEYAVKCIGLAFILDGLDGRVARRLNATSAFGREFDSLSDVIAFGVAPGVLVYCWGFRASADEIGVLASFFYTVCGAARLARFNITTSDEVKTSFTGLPIPGAAAAVASLVYAFPQPLEHIAAVTAMLLFMLVLGGLMVSTFPFFSFKKVKLPREQQRMYLIVLALATALAWKFSTAALALGTSGYAVSGLVHYAWRELFKKPKVDESAAAQAG